MVWEHQPVLVVQQLVSTKLAMQATHRVVTVQFFFKQVNLLLFNTRR
jgi:hypothetical protein